MMHAAADQGKVIYYRVLQSATKHSVAHLNPLIISVFPLPVPAVTIFCLDHSNIQGCKHSFELKLIYAVRT
jgi:hypothetical protein